LAGNIGVSTNNLTEQNKTVVVDEVTIEVAPFAVTVYDGVVLRGERYNFVQSGSGRKRSDQRSDTPLLCIHSGLGSTREFAGFALKLQLLQDAPRQIIALNLRGCGTSDRADVSTYTAQTEADDIVAVCDALGLHGIDVIANGQGAAPVFLTGIKRPTLFNRLILNDAATENDPVGIVRMQSLSGRRRIPTDWQQATSDLKELFDPQFPALTADHWETMAKIVWKTESIEGVEGHKPASDFDFKLVPIKSGLDFDERQPTYWFELAIHKNKHLLLLRGEHSPLITRKIADGMKQIVPKLHDVVVTGQGHVPMLESFDLPEKINGFLNRETM